MRPRHQPLCVTFTPDGKCIPAACRVTAIGLVSGHPASIRIAPR